jgi:hypothetical protein
MMLRRFFKITLALFLSGANAFAEQQGTQPRAFSPVIVAPPIPTIPGDSSGGGNNSGVVLPDPVTGRGAGGGGIVNPTFPNAPIGGGVPGGGGTPIVINPNPISNPNNPWQPVPGVGGAIGGGIINLNYSCSLVDPGAYADLLSTLTVLEGAIKAPDACKEKASLPDSVKNFESMKQAASELRRIWEDQENLNANLVPFNSQLETMMSGIGNLSDTLNNNSFLNSSCGQEMMTKGNVLLAFSDLVSGLAPYTLFAAAAATSMSAAVPYVLGVVGVSSVIKILARMSENTVPFNMANEAHRQTLLKATCEYNKVATKMRYLELAQSGKFKEISEEIESLNNRFDEEKKSANFYINQTFKVSLDDILNKRKAYYDQIDSIREQVLKDKLELQTINQEIIGSGQFFSCDDGREFIRRHDEGIFPATVGKNFTTLLNTGIGPKGFNISKLEKKYDSAMANLKASTRTSTGPFATYYNPNGYDPCTYQTKNFVATLTELLQATELESIKQSDLYEKELKKQPAYLDWYRKTSSLERDRETLQRMAKTLEKAANENNNMMSIEVSQRMQAIRSGLFGRNESFSWYKIPGMRHIFMEKESPVESWLKHTFDFFSRQVSYFNLSVKSLLGEVDEIRIKRANQSRNLEPSIAKTLVNSWTDLYWKLRLQKQLEFINKNNFPADTDRHGVACRRLEEAWLNWSSGLQYLEAMKHFCKFIDPYITNEVSVGVRSYCGWKKLDGKVDSKSEISQAESKLAEEPDSLYDLGHKQIALAIFDKMSKLECVIGK